MRKTKASAYDVLTYAHDLVLAGWCQGPYAKGATGCFIDPLHPEACQFCSMGALMRAIRDLNAYSVGERAQSFLNRTTKDESPSFVHYNETKGRTQHEVLAKFALAARNAKEAGEK